MTPELRRLIGAYKQDILDLLHESNRQAEIANCDNASIPSGRSSPPPMELEEPNSNREPTGSARRRWRNPGALAIKVSLLAASAGQISFGNRWPEICLGAIPVFGGVSIVSHLPRQGHTESGCESKKEIRGVIVNNFLRFLNFAIT